MEGCKSINVKLAEDCSNYREKAFTAVIKGGVHSVHQANHAERISNQKTANILTDRHTMIYCRNVNL